MTIDGIDSTTAGYTVVSTHHPWSALLPDTAGVTIIPLQAGTYPLTVHAHYTDDDFLDSEETFQVVLDVAPNPGTLSYSPAKLIDFGAEGLCNPVTIVDSLTVSTGGCNPIIDSMNFYPDLPQDTDFSFAPVRNSAPENGTVTSFPISFQPSMADTETGQPFSLFWNDGELAARGYDPGRRARAFQDTRSFSIQPANTHGNNVRFGGGNDIFYQHDLRNLRDRFVTLPNGIELPLPPSGTPQVPLFLQTGAADSLVVTISPGTGGSGTAPIQLGDAALWFPLTRFIPIKAARRDSIRRSRSRCM